MRRAGGFGTCEGNIVKLNYGIFDALWYIQIKSQIYLPDKDRNPKMEV